MLGVLKGRGHPVDATLEPADAQPGWRSRMPPRMYLPKMSRNGRHGLDMPMLTALNSLGDAGGLSPMWCEIGTCDSSMASQTPSMAVLA